MTSTEITRTKTNHHYYFRVLTALAALALAASLLVAMVAKPAHAAETTFTVNSTSNEEDAAPTDGHCDVDPATGGDQCTLNAALTEATLNPAGSDIIKFNVPGSGVHTIKPNRPLILSGNVTIDGYSQLGASANTLQQGTNAALKIELDGSNLGIDDDGVKTFEDNVVIRGLMINNFKNNGISIEGQNNKVEGNFIGTDAGGFIAKPNTQAGVSISGNVFRAVTNNTVGGTTPDKRNVISGNFGAGVEIKDDSGNSQKVINNSVVGNLIGTDRDGTGRLGNTTGASIITGATGNTIGGTTPASANTIAFNQGPGVSVSDDSVGNRVLYNSIFSNVGLGIDLNRNSGAPSDGVTTNDTGDADTGANNLQNFPVISSAKTGSKGTSIAGKLNSIPSKSFRIQFFASPEADSSGNGQGKTFIGEKVVTTGADANASFTFKPSQKVPKGQVITTTATDEGGNTSEFSAAKKVVRKR